MTVADMPQPETTPPRLDVAGVLEGQTIFITGATGFLGKVLVERLLSTVPGVRRLLLMIRPGGGRTAQERLEGEVLARPLTARLRAIHGDRWQEWASSKVEAVAGDLGEERFGLSEEAYGDLCRRVDRVVGNAATVTFDERLDKALSLNALGALRTLGLARDAGNVPLLHVSTCFVSGWRQGTVPERVVTAEELDADAVLAALEEARGALWRREADPEAAVKEEEWVRAGAEVADRFGFNDVYTLTKALAERLLARRRGAVPLAILRPAIVESAHTGPLPGWIEAVRVSDPLLVAYGRGRTEEFSGTADAPLELVPVDFVAHALMAALAALPETAEEGKGDEEIPVYQLGSSRNPITLGQLMDHARKGFETCPLWSEAGEPIVPGEARFVETETYGRRLEEQLAAVRKRSRWLPGRFASKKRELRRAERTLEHLLHLLSVYSPYFSHGARYDDAQVQALWNRLPAEARRELPFDVGALDWPSYVARVHVPGLVRFALKAETGAPVPVPEEERESQELILGRASELAGRAQTTFDLFAATAEAYPEVMAFQTFRAGMWLRYTYAQALTATANVAARLRREHGIGAGDRVVLLSTGRPEWVLATFAAHRLGAVTVPLDPQWPAQEVLQAAELVGAKVILAAPPLVEPLAGAALPVMPLAAPFVPEPEVGLLPGAEEVGRAGRAEDLASIIFTSGTTVAPKAVPLTHGNFLANVRDLVPLMELTRERLLSVLPIHHVFEQMVGLLVPLAGGSTFSYVAEIKPAEISWMMATTKPTVLVAVPRLLELLHGGIMANVAAGGPMLRLIFRILFALSRRKDGANGVKLFAKVHRRFGGHLRRIASGGSALEPGLGRSFQLMGFQVAEGYGMTETSPVLTVNQWREIRFGTVGKPLPSVEIDLRPPSEELAELPEGAGEVWVKGPNVMSGYYQDPQATAAAMDGEWLNTGDVGFFDEEGRLRLSGRTKDVIVTSAGKNVYPEEVEVRYRDLPGVAELVVLGLPAGGGGEKVVALVVPAPGVAEDAIRAAFAERSKEVPSYQQVAGVEFWRGDLPKTTTMKVKRSKLRAAVLAGERGSGKTSAPPAPPAAEPRTDAERQVIEALAGLTRTRPDLLQADDRLLDLGVDSLTRVELVGELEARFGVRVSNEQAASLERVRDLFSLGSEGGRAS